MALTPENGSVVTLEQKLGRLGLDDRRRTVHRFLPLEDGFGLEIAPNWAPIVTKSEGDVLYCDYLTYEQLLEREKTNPGRIEYGLKVQRLDFVWQVGRTLEQCSGDVGKFDYVVSCHVFEHVPNFLEYLYQVRAVLKDDGVIAMVLPDIRGSGEYFRRETNAADLINSYLLGQSSPSPGQVYDGLQNLFAFENVPLRGLSLADVKRLFTDIDCYNAALRASTEYVDVHCWAFSKDGFSAVARELGSIGLFDFEIEEIESNPLTQTGHGSEFYVKLRPTAPPRPSHHLTLKQNDPLLARISSLEEELRAVVEAREQLARDKGALELEIARVSTHSERAFQEAVAAQDLLKAEKVAAETALSQAVAHGERAFQEALAAQDLLKWEKAAAESNLEQALVTNERLKADRNLLEHKLSGLERAALVKLGRRLGLVPSSWDP
ncbi:Methyltransferase domain-containing protein [Enhydrobacter aerosaccus]|uniref:Methyltransferase domain-containing protein n=1 Tax=Enhydrobacter aerosaccus TaxID=225324 RepID=A0A1T4SC09_9HYPH|nr:class I SAM-dependent methyltransferase [Enhydrobacter aerosaccus]SKA25830.1 Methyltransferase domain-containing protein [Enhydrobacter aerosaccus]